MSVCASCGKDNQSHYKFCLGCGSELADDAPSPSSREAPRTHAAAASESHPSPAAATDARPCAACGTPIPTGFTFCGQCGARAPATTSSASPGRSTVEQRPIAGALSGRLVLVRPDGSEGGSHPLVEGENPVGRSAGSLFEADGYLSPQHAILVLNAAGLVIRDNRSLNGVFVRLTDEIAIDDGDVFRMGQELLRFDVIPPAEPLEDGTEVLGSPNPGYWGRLAVIVARDQEGSAFPLFGDAILLGRERGDILFPEDGYVSGTHARLCLRDGRYWLSDMNSSNGTFIRIRGEIELTSGSFILMGQQLFRVAFS